MARKHRGISVAALVAAIALAAPTAWAQTASERKWEVEGHGGFATSTTPTGGTAATLPAGASFITLAGSTSRYEPSWLFGDGAVLINGINSVLAPTAKITPLDVVIGNAAVSRDSGGAAGFRVTRRFGPRYSAEFSFDYAHTPLTFTEKAVNGIEASRSSFVNAFTGLFRSGPSPNPAVTATTTFTGGNGSELFTTGVFGFDLMTHGKLIPFVVGGGGVAHASGDTPAVTLVGNYTFTVFSPAAINETDRVTIRVSGKSNSPIGVFGGGVRYVGSPRWGIRGDVRFLAGGGTHDVLVDASPSVVLSTPGVILISPPNPSAVFSSANSSTSRSSLTAPAISGLRTFTASGSVLRTKITAGVYVRF